MRRWRKFRRLLPAERRLIMRALFWLGVIRLGLWLLPFQTLQRLLAGLTRAPARESHGPPSFDQIAWAVAAASRYVPSATCLTRALVTRTLLAQRGYAAHLCIGVARRAGGQLDAHAWVESPGQIVIGGGSRLGRYTRLPSGEQSRS